VRRVADAEADPSSHLLFANGLAQFRAGRFFEAHEEWEKLWMTSDGDAKVFLQALIQLAAACVHLKRGNAAPGMRLLALAAGKLDRFGEAYGDVRLDFLRRGIATAQEQLRDGAAPGEAAKTLRL
jgi:predicted metal-dependent hydrolase